MNPAKGQVWDLMDLHNGERIVLKERVIKNKQVFWKCENGAVIKESELLKWWDFRWEREPSY